MADESSALEAARRRLATLGVLCNKSETIRAAIGVLSSASDVDLLGAASAIAKLKPGPAARAGVSKSPSKKPKRKS